MHRRLMVGIGPEAAFRQRHADTPEALPAVFFPTMADFARLMSPQTFDLLAAIRRHKPDSILQLVDLTGQKSSTVSATLKTLEQKGLVRLTRGEGYRVRAEVDYDEIQLVFLLNA